MLGVLGLLTRLLGRRFRLSNKIYRFNVSEFQHGDIQLTIRFLRRGIRAAAGNFFFLRGIMNLFSVHFRTIRFFNGIGSLYRRGRLLLRAIIFRLGLDVFRLHSRALALPLRSFQRVNTSFSRFNNSTFRALLSRYFRHLAFNFTHSSGIIRHAVRHHRGFDNGHIRVLLLNYRRTQPT